MKRFSMWPRFFTAERSNLSNFFGGLGTASIWPDWMVQSRNGYVLKLQTQSESVLYTSSLRSRRPQNTVDTKSRSQYNPRMQAASTKTGHLWVLAAV
jgi:hypothetical protein